MLTNLRPGSHIVDATLGAGKDTLALAKILGGMGKITGYDIQEEALERTRETLAQLTEKERSIITLKHASHVCIEERDLDLIVYNLGYLPGGNKAITTRVETTLQSIKSALQALNSHGRLSITCYPGHEEGAKEQRVLVDYLSSLDKKRWKVNHTQVLNREKAPSVIIVNGI